LKTKLRVAVNKRALVEESYAVDLCEDGAKGLRMAPNINYGLLSEKGSGVFLRMLAYVGQLPSLTTTRVPESDA
jgi:hypothetical protein